MPVLLSIKQDVSSDPQIKAPDSLLLGAAAPMGTQKRMLQLVPLSEVEMTFLVRVNPTGPDTLGIPSAQYNVSRKTLAL